MKKKIILFVLSFIPICVFSQAVSLDNALRNSSTYLNGRLQRDSKVVVLNFTSNWQQLSEYVIDELIGYIVNDGTFTVVDRHNLESVCQELNFQLSGEVNDETASSIGHMLGAQAIISGSIQAIGSAYRLRVRVISVETAQILGMHNVDVSQDSRIAALTGTAYAGTSATSSTPSRGLLAVSPATWEHGDDPLGQRHTKFSTGRETIQRQQKDVLTVEVTLQRPPENEWVFGQVVLERTNVPLISRFREANGVRFSVLGDGKTWSIAFPMIETEVDYDTHHFVINTRRNSVINVNIPYSSLRQSGWGQPVPFDKRNITAIVLQRNQNFAASDGWGLSTIKIFDFEIY